MRSRLVRSRLAFNTVDHCYILYKLLEKIRNDKLKVLAFIDFFLNFHSTERNRLWEKIYVPCRLTLTWNLREERIFSRVRGVSHCPIFMNLYGNNVPLYLGKMGIEKSLEIVHHSCYKEVTSLIHSFIHFQVP